MQKAWKIARAQKLAQMHNLCSQWAQKLAQMCQESKIIMYAQSVLKDNPKIDIAVLIAQAVQDSKCTNPKLAHAYTSIVRHQWKN